MDDIIEFVFEVIIEFVGGFVSEIIDSAKAKRAKKRKIGNKSENAQNTENSGKQTDEQ